LALDDEQLEDFEHIFDCVRFRDLFNRADFDVQIRAGAMVVGRSYAPTADVIVSRLSNRRRAKYPASAWTVAFEDDLAAGYFGQSRALAGSGKNNLRS
jgi:hypothetical protein